MRRTRGQQALWGMEGLSAFKPYAYPCERCGLAILQRDGVGRIKRFCSAHCRYADRYYLRRRTHCETCKRELERPGRKRCRHCARMRAIWDRLQKHGLSCSAVWAMLDSQNHACRVCHEPIAIGGMHVDHDHAHCPGEYGCVLCVRGLLCPGCNVGLGSFGDDAQRLRNAADYLDWWALESLARWGVFTPQPPILRSQSPGTT